MRPRSRNWRRDPKSQDPSDLAGALIALVGENVGLICVGLAKAAGVERIVYGGTTLRNNARDRAAPARYRGDPRL